MGDIAPLTIVQRRLGLGLAAFAAAVFPAVTDVPLRLLVGVALAIALGVTAWRRQRVAAAVFAFATALGGPWGFAYVFAAPFAAYALWLLSGATSNADRRNDSSSPRRRTSERNVGS